MSPQSIELKHEVSSADREATNKLLNLENPNFEGTLKREREEPDGPASRRHKTLNSNGNQMGRSTETLRNLINIEESAPLPQPS